MSHDSKSLESNSSSIGGAKRRPVKNQTGGLSGPVFLGISDKSQSALPILGTQDHFFEVHHDCFRLPDHLRWMATHGVAIDRDGYLYVIHQTTTQDPIDAIFVFDPQREFVRSFGKEFHGGGHGLSLRAEDGEEFLYVADVKGYIAKVSIGGEIVWMKSAPQEFEPYSQSRAIRCDEVPRQRQGVAFAPTNIAFGPDGGFYVADGYGSHYVIRYDRNANPLAVWGGHGSEQGKLSTPHGIWFDDRPGRTPSLVVADRANSRLQYYSPEGTLLSSANNVLSPCQMNTQGPLMVIADLRARVTVFDEHNRLLAHLGDDAAWRTEVMDGYKLRTEPERWQPGKFVHPHHACFDRDGNIYVAEWVSIGRVSFLRRLG